MYQKLNGIGQSIQEEENFSSTFFISGYHFNAIFQKISENQALGLCGWCITHLFFLSFRCVGFVAVATLFVFVCT